MSEERRFDPDLNVRGVIWTGTSLAVGILLILLLSWGVFLGLRRLEKAADPPPPALREVRERRLPPEPRLQSSPDGDMLRLRADEDQLLERPAWIDEKQGTLRIPVDFAIDVLARRGLPAVTGAPASTPGALAVPAPAAPTPQTTAPSPPSSGGPH